MGCGVNSLTIRAWFFKEDIAMTVSGAYGRDYKSLKAAKVDWDANKDFVIRDMFHGGGRYVNREQTINMKEAIMVRYAKDRKIGVLN
jgi:hypothetical protein